jgi:hypothetical protein
VATLVEIVCPNCQHRGFISAASLPRTLQCVGCGQAHHFERAAPGSLRQLTRAQRVGAIAAIKTAVRRQREEAHDVLVKSDPIAGLRRLNAARRAKRRSRLLTPDRCCLCVKD